MSIIKETPEPFEELMVGGHLERRPSAKKHRLTGVGAESSIDITLGDNTTKSKKKSIQSMAGYLNKSKRKVVDLGEPLRSKSS